MGDVVRVLKISLGSFTESFIKIQHLEVCQESTHPPSHFLESWSKGMFLMELEMVSRNSRYPREVLLKVSSRSTSGSLSRLCLSSKSLPGVLEERDVLDGAGNGVMVLKISQGSFTESFIKIHHEEACKDYKYHQSLFLESWGTWRFLMDLEMVEGGLVYP